MFADLLPPPELRRKLEGAMLTGAVLDREHCSIELQLKTREALSPSELDDLKRMRRPKATFSNTFK